VGDDGAAVGVGTPAAAPPPPPPSNGLARAASGYIIKIRPSRRRC